MSSITNLISVGVNGTGTANSVMKWLDADTATDSIIYDNGTNIGIGTSSPQRNLVVQNSNSVSLISVVSSPSTTAYLLLGDTDSDAQGRVQYNNSEDSLQLYTLGSERMRIDSSGNVSIGATSSLGGQPLFIKNTTSAEAVMGIQSSSASGYSAIDLYDTAGSAKGALGYGNASVAVTSVRDAVYMYSTTDLRFLSGGLNERMRIDSSGNVGIGESNPTAALHIAQGALKIRSDNETTSYAYMSFENSGGSFSFGVERSTGGGLMNNTSAYATVLGTNNATDLSFGTNLFQRMRILSSGNIILNSTVYGNTVSSSPRTLYIDTVGGLGGISSIRASKTNIQDVNDVNWIYDLSPVEFNYRKTDEEGNYTDEFFEDKNFGLIAEDTEPIADFLINYNEDENGVKEMKGIEYSRLITPMLKAIQELKAEIETLKSQINA